MSSINPLKDSVIFTFLQGTRHGHFKRETDWGFEVAGTDMDTSKDRWGKVKLVGPDVKYVKPDDYILVESTKWTTGVEVEGETMWRTKEEFIMLTSDEVPQGLV